jgi:hypothetical protein
MEHPELGLSRCVGVNLYPVWEQWPPGPFQKKTAARRPIWSETIVNVSLLRVSVWLFFQPNEQESLAGDPGEEKATRLGVLSGYTCCGFAIELQ